MLSHRDTFYDVTLGLDAPPGRFRFASLHKQKYLRISWFAKLAPLQTPSQAISPRYCSWEAFSE